MMRRLAALSMVAIAMASAVTIDRIAVIAGNRLIKASDIDRDLRVTEFLNNEPLSLSADAKKKAAERLIDQTIIREEIATGGFTWAAYPEATAVADRIRKDRFQDSAARMNQALSQYGINESELREQLRLQLTVIRFIDERFRAGVLVSDEDLQKYYDEHRADLVRQYPNGNSLETLSPAIRTSLEGERVNQEFEAWLQEVRKSERIEYRKGALE
jgi:peptidyl-prolyl cis-trans isomerase SurA